MAVVGFDDSQMAKLTRPPLTTILSTATATATGLAETAVEMLTALLRGEPVDPVVLPTELIRRGSA
nr:substrate-binding domain-containing protein [Nesterenkonia massiliensis]